MSDFAMVGVNPESMLVESIAAYTMENLSEAAKSGLMTVRTTLENARKVWGEKLNQEQFMALSA